MAARTHNNNSKQAAPSNLSSERAGWIQRACACGQHTIGGSPCEGCNKKRLRRRATNDAEPSGAPPIVEETLRSAGQPLDTETRHLMESRFAHDFSRVQAHRPAPQRAARGLAVGPSNDEFEQEADRVAENVMKQEKTDERDAHTLAPRADFSRVRVHTGARAAESARMLDAVAYTVGHDVVFDAGQYAPATPKGQELLAHELVHVVQQTGGSKDSASDVVQSKARERTPIASGIYDFFSNIVQLFSSGFAPETLQEYVDTLLATKQIEDSFDSDNKAYEVYKLWHPRQGKERNQFKVGEQTYNMTEELKKLLAAELRSGKVFAAEEAAATELDRFTPDKTAAQPAATTAAGPQAPAPKEESLTGAEKGAAKIRESLRGQVGIRELKGKKYQVGGIEVSKPAQTDIKANNLLLNKEDTGHIEFFDRKLGIDTSYTAPRDAFRWNLLKEIIATGKVEILAIGESEMFDVREAMRTNIDPKTKKSLSSVKAKGVTILREQVYNLTAASQPALAISFVSTTDRDQVIYSTGFTSVAHELFGHIWLAMNGVPSGHRESLKGTHTIKDPFGEPFAGDVNDFIDQFIQPSPRTKARKGEESPSLSMDITQQKFEDAVAALVRALSATNAFTMEGLFIRTSNEVLAAWGRLEKFYKLLLINQVNEGHRLSYIISQLKPVYDAYDEDAREGFDTFIFKDASTPGTGRTNPQGHIVAELKIPDPKTRPPRKKKTNAPQPSTQGKGQTGKVQPKLVAPYRNEFAPPEVRTALRSTGRPLEASTRTLMESRFQHDFSRVRVHTDAQAGESARSINAHAYTVGNNLFFAQGQYRPQALEGTRLIAHELAHTIQQSSGAQIKDGVSRASDPFERHADAVAEAVTEGRSVSELLSAYQPSAGKRSTGRAVQRQARTTEQHSERADTDEETPKSSSDPLVLAGIVGAGGMNRAEDVAKVQARLRALGILSEDDFEAESPPSATTTLPFEAAEAGGADSTTVSTPAINLPADSLRGQMPLDSLGAHAPHATLPSTSANTTATADTAQAVVPESSLTATILAIREFQRALFSKEAVDGNISPAGPTWRSLSTTDEASFAKMKEQWETKKQQTKEEEEKKRVERERMKEEEARKQKEEEGRKQLEAARKQKEADQKSTEDAKKILSTYATYLPLMSSYVSLDESGLARLLAIKAQHEAETVLKVFDALQEDDALQVASELVLSATVGELSEFALAVLLRLKTVIRFGEKSADTPLLLELINSAIMLQNKKALPPSKGASVVEELKEQIKAGRITFNYKEQEQELLNEHPTRPKVSSLLQALVLELSKSEHIVISSLTTLSSGALRAPNHGIGRAVDIGNELIAPTLLPKFATDAKVAELKIDEVIFNASVVGEKDPQKWNYDGGKKYNGYDAKTMADHKDHIHFAVKAK